MIRLIKKIPFISLIKLARRADYKARSDETHKFKKAYADTVRKVAEMLDEHEIFHTLTPERTEGFTSLYLPRQKVMDTAYDLEKADLLLNLRDATSVKEVQRLINVDPTFRALLKIVIKITIRHNFDVLASILENLDSALK